MKILILAPLHDENKACIEAAFPNCSFVYSTRYQVTQTMIDACDIIIGNPKDHVDLCRDHIRMIQLNSAGSDHYIVKGRLSPKTLLANASGVHSDAMAEHTIGMILASNKSLFQYYEHMKEHLWKEERGFKELYGSTTLIVGLGDIGYEIARRLKSFHCHIIGIKRTMSSVPDEIDELYLSEDIDHVLPRADYVISCLPHTKETVHFFNQKRFQLMKDDASFINIGRGSAVDTEALKRTLASGKLYAVCLDVFETEPLDPDDSLWDEPRVFITPHVAGGYDWKSARDQLTSLVIRNLKHYFNGEKLENEVDFSTGYRRDVQYKK